MSRTVPNPTQLTYEQMDEITELTGIDLTDMENLPKGKILAALDTWGRYTAGEDVNFATVYKTAKLGDLVMADVGADPLDEEPV